MRLCRLAVSPPHSPLAGSEPLFHTASVSHLSAPGGCVELTLVDCLFLWMWCVTATVQSLPRMHTCPLHAMLRWLVLLVSTT